MNQKQLHMQPVSSRYLEQYNALLRYVFQVTDQELSSVGWQEKEFIRAKFPTMEKADVIGWFDRDTLVSQVAVYPMQARIFGRTYAMGGLTGVGTYPEYSNLGLMHKLLEQALTNMRARGQYLSYLYPYSIPYYRRKGWEVVSDKISYVIQDFQLPKARQVPGYVRRVKTDSEALNQTYARFAQHTHGAVLRDELAWNEYWLWDPDDIMAAIYYNEQDQPDGYVIYWIANEVFHIKDMIFNNETARAGLWNFVSAHFSMITRVEGSTYTDEPLAFLLEDASILHGADRGLSPVHRRLPLQARRGGPELVLHPHRPPAALEPGELPADHLPGRAGAGRAHPRSLPGQGEHPDHDHHAPGLQTAGLPGQDRPPAHQRGHHRHAGGRHRAADPLHLRLLLRAAFCRRPPSMRATRFSPD